VHEKNISYVVTGTVGWNYGHFYQRVCWNRRLEKLHRYDNVVGLVCAPNTVWVGTSGGILRFTLADSAFQKFTNSEGLTAMMFSAIGLDTHARYG